MLADYQPSNPCWPLCAIIQVLTQQVDYQTARKYWNKLKWRLCKKGSESVTNCHRLKLPAADGKNYLTDVATSQMLSALIQSYGVAPTK